MPEEYVFEGADRNDRELIDLETAAALAGEEPLVFWAQANRHDQDCGADCYGSPCGMYPPPHGWPDERKQWTKDDHSRWVRVPRWRRGNVLAAVDKRDKARAVNPMHQMGAR